MTKIEALTTLLEQVEAGKDWHFDECLPPVDLPDVWMDAFHGSLDAAETLHEAVLPGFFWQRQGFVMIVTNDHTGWGNGIYGRGRGDDNPARAWLIAILKALIALEEGHD